MVSLQNVAEFWNVSTRPIDKNGYGLSAERTRQRLAFIERICEVVTEDDRSYRIWKNLLTTHSVTGDVNHDARSGICNAFAWHLHNHNAQTSKTFTATTAFLRQLRHNLWRWIFDEADEWW